MAWQQNPTSGVYYNMETGEVSQPGNPPPGFVPPPAQGSYEQLMAAVAPQLVSGGEGGDYMNSGGTGTWQGPSGTVYNIIGSRVFNFNPGQAGHINPADAPILNRSGLYQTTAQDASDAMNPDAPGNGNGGGGLTGRGGAFSDPEFWGGLASVVLPGVGNALGLSAEAMAAAKAATAAATGGNPLLAVAGSYAGNALGGNMGIGEGALSPSEFAANAGVGQDFTIPSDLEYAARAASDITPTSMGAPSFNVTDVTSDTFGAGGVTSPTASVVSEAIGTPSALDISGGLDQAVAPLDISGGLDQAVAPAGTVAGTAGTGSALDISGGLDQAVLPAATVAAVGGATGGGYDLGGDTGLTAPGTGNVLSDFMNSVGSSPIMRAIQAGVGIAGIVSGMTSTDGMISPATAGAMADPFASYRQQYIDQLNALMANPSLITSTPGYQFNLQQGLAGLDARQARSGVSRTGAGDIGVQQYGQQQAMSSFDQQVRILSALSGANQNPSAGAQAALNAQGQQVSQNNAGWQAIGQGIGGLGQSLGRGVPAAQLGGYSTINPSVNADYTQGYDPNTPSMQPMGGYVADPTTGMAEPQNLWGA